MKPAKGFDKDADFGLKADAFTFVPSISTLAFDTGSVVVLPQQVGDIFNHSKPLTDFDMSNGTLVNRGIPVNDVATAMKVRLPAISVEWAEAKAGDPIPPAIFTTAKDKITTYRPVLAKNAAETPNQIHRAPQLS